MRETAVRSETLSPVVTAAVEDALDSRTATLPVALADATAAAAAGDGRPPSRGDPPGLRAVDAAVASLSGYAHLRRNRGSAPDRECRAVALLASDYLHASAHAALGSAAVPPERRRALYATLTAGSADLAASLFAASTGRAEGSAVVVATLAETGCALGAAVGTASRETVEAMAAYGRSLATAAGRGEGGTALDRIEAAVAGDRPARDPAAGDEPAPADGHVERARAALETLPEGEPRRRLERATRVIGRRSSE